MLKAARTVPIEVLFMLPIAGILIITSMTAHYAIAPAVVIICTGGIATTWLSGVGVLAARKLDRLVAYSIIGSMGMVMVAISLFTPAGIAAALYYIVHSTLAGAVLFLVSDLVRTGRGNVDLTTQAPMLGTALTSAMFFLGAIAMAGLPPLSGFLGKLLVLDAGFDSTLMVWIWAIVLSSSLISILGFARAGSVVFWKAHSVAPPEEPIEDTTRPTALAYSAVGGLFALLIAHTVFAGQVHGYTTTMAAQLFAPDTYKEVVLDTPGKLSKPKDDKKEEDH